MWFISCQQRKSLTILNKHYWVYFRLWRFLKLVYKACVKIQAACCNHRLFEKNFLKTFFSNFIGILVDAPCVLRHLYFWLLKFELLEFFSVFSSLWNAHLILILFLCLSFFFSISATTIFEKKGKFRSMYDKMISEVET